ncbi:MAG: FAD-dependent oxidoreductase [Paracoccaceae bacterium]
MTTADRAAPRGGAYDREEQIFPRLTDEQMARVARFGRREALEPGTTVFARGERTVDCFVLFEGTIDIIDHRPDGERVITTHGARNFTGEVDLFNDRAILVSGRIGERADVLRLDRQELKRLMAAEPDIGEIVTRALILRRMGLIEQTQGGVTLIGPRLDRDTLRIERFLRRNGYPVRLLDTGDDPRAGEWLALSGIGADRLPAVLNVGDAALHNPSNFALARALGLVEQPDGWSACDCIVVGGGPSGLAAAVYAASEGLATLVIENEAPGGQASTSSKIENYLGFPTGISGGALAARAAVQAQKFGTIIAVARHAVALDCERRPYKVRTEDGAVFAANSVVIASGARYRRLDLEELPDFEGAGVHYAATALEADLCGGQEVAVVGGGNSAGQAAVYLARHASHVHMLVRGGDLASSMSDYLVERIEASSRITLHTRTEVSGLEGERYLERVRWRNRDTGAEERREMRNLFLMIGAEPNTAWLDGCVGLDDKGFVRTGEAVGEAWPRDDRRPASLETSRPGVFAVGDVRSGSTKRVASAVGEGSIAVSHVHAALAELPEAPKETLAAALPRIGAPGTVAEFQRRRLRDWGLDDLAGACVSSEQAVLVHHCALYVRLVWQEIAAGGGGEPPTEAIRHCVTELVRRSEMLERADRAFRDATAFEHEEPDLRRDEALFAAVAEGLRPFAQDTAATTAR